MQEELCECGVYKSLPEKYHFHKHCPVCGGLMANANNVCSAKCWDELVVVYPANAVEEIVK